MNKYIECTKEINKYFKTKGYNPNFVIANHYDFALVGLGARNIYFYGHQFENNKVGGKVLKNISEIMRWEFYIFEHIKTFLEKWNIEDEMFVFSVAQNSYGHRDLITLSEIKKMYKIDQNL